ncbi:hypothetical protein [Acinetobacter tandoii]|uniref:Transcriptional regulator SutA RNAP-binding domain-containing protein n=1 Tax=Acinetobacter tandoii DSM 14970 = CIP 107469 TaxID=1120927 RepID=R9B7P4_9GAMM|nr:hypothetical protein [Acinetobacter tandoii]EOR06694.1 hypothetical protein I593_02282 [Acinetobacter tandoii DSM 14970 = CIP 107469]EOR06825.1 hypothetical protein I593_01692 [Acinetobacter tandoii DSM 14970 = CIP 107469]EOR10483.1 hypothetical protein I593_00837 [Acinetobacter tandoii DSM 14970 = CIP 107469]EOR11388.1 hypothetical protein I593_00002 [Acinetobacter tandoii DSM 14970 = CIP 107469]
MNELLQQRIQAVQIGRNTTFAQMEQKKSLRDELDSQLEAFLSNGGAIEQLPQGFSGEYNKGWNNSKPKAQKTMREVMASAVSEARARRNNPSVTARNEALNKGEKRYHGTTCKACGGTLRYTSNNCCVGCDKAASIVRTKKLREKRKSEKVKS